MHRMSPQCQRHSISVSESTRGMIQCLQWGNQIFHTSAKTIVNIRISACLHQENGHFHKIHSYLNDLYVRL
jgi:hypothetical protein